MPQRLPLIDGLCHLCHLRPIGRVRGVGVELPVRPRETKCSRVAAIAKPFSLDELSDAVAALLAMRSG